MIKSLDHPSLESVIGMLRAEQTNGKTEPNPWVFEGLTRTVIQNTVTVDHWCLMFPISTLFYGTNYSKLN